MTGMCTCDARSTWVDQCWVRECARHNCDCPIHCKGHPCDCENCVDGAWQ